MPLILVLIVGVLRVYGANLFGAWGNHDAPLD